MLFHSEVSQAYAHLACHTILPNEGLCDKLKGYLLTLLPHVSSHASMCGYPGWPIMVFLWMPGLSKNLFLFLFFLFF